ncbi:cell division protein SepF [Selenomonas sp. FOBRC6]|jgi:cell division protein sepF 2|uniref:cell division protein SepF n=1 Tax=Selenomonas sp. FOBRC6 TaxID=936572 RepID=UPI000277F58F|nr:cell division protein SepF [Selenomonas sp. FOBRC6]EJO20322.1 PF04472 family protein [Selenomonas sp. FOBRC6]
MGANSFFSRVKDMTSRVVDSFIPAAYDEEYEDEEVVQQVQQTAAQPRQEAMTSRRVANGGTVSFPSASYSTSSVPRTPTTGDGGTPLTVHTTKVAELKVRIHRPRRYDDVGTAVVQLKQGIAVAVNFDCLNDVERRRVCDFLNGACYVLHGTARVVSSTIILYAPKGVDVTEAAAQPH